MRIFEAEISLNCIDFFKENFSKIQTMKEANQRMFDSFGIKSFFDTYDDFYSLKNNILTIEYTFEEHNKIEYGDFQTNLDLAKQCIQYFLLNNNFPELVIEPTCGKGNFILAALELLPHTKTIIGIEFYKPYIWQAKFNIVDFFLKNLVAIKPEIIFYNISVFEFNFTTIPAFSNVLIVGNPPWVTNSKLSTINSKNLPSKTNFKKHDGLDALTGKGNFDISEFITLMLLNCFHKKQGTLMFLIKNSVIKNIVFDQKNNAYHIGSLEKHVIDSKKEFNVSVDASLFYCKLNTTSAFSCKEIGFYENKPLGAFGWVGNKYVSDISIYNKYNYLDGDCCFIWRQGIKHDCSSVMELEKKGDNLYQNALAETVELENDLVYGMLKSSDLKNKPIVTPRKYTIVTQKKVGDETIYIKELYPKTYLYLSSHEINFSERKSIIYKNKPKFSIFGVGDYTFKPYKVAISGLYKTFFFTLVLPINTKPLVADDTCYFIGFDVLEFAVYSFMLLNSEIATKFFQSITFSDSKRVFTKDILMRIDFSKLVTSFDKEYLQEKLNTINIDYNLNINLNRWHDYLALLSPKTSAYQSTMF